MKGKTSFIETEKSFDFGIQEEMYQRTNNVVEIKKEVWLEITLKVSFGWEKLRILNS